jgi:hypothetical protein
VLALTSLKSSLTESSVDGPSATPAHHQVILRVIACLALLSDPLDLPATPIWLRGGEQGGQARAHVPQTTRHVIRVCVEYDGYDTSGCLCVHTRARARESSPPITCHDAGHGPLA